MVGFIDFKEVIAAADMLAVAKWLNLPLHAEGQSHRCECPVHKGGRRSLIITPGKEEHGVFYCQTARKGGKDPIRLAAHVLEVSDKEAAHRINDQFGNRTVPREQCSGNSTVPHGSPRSASSEGEADRSRQLDDAHRATLDRILSTLQADHEALETLEIGVDFAKEWGIGYVPRGTLVGRLGIALHDRTGQLVGFCGVSLKENDPQPFRYPSNLDLQSVIFNAHRLQPGPVRILSNPLQVVQSLQYTDDQAVCFLTETVTALQLEWLAALIEEKHCEIVF